jgi:PKD repeat protein
MKNPFTLLRSKQMLLFASLFFILQFSKAQLSIIGDTSVCAGETQTYSNPVSGTTYFWGITGGNGFSSTDSIVVQWGNPGTGIIIAVTTNGNTVTFTDTLYVTIHAKPNPVISFLPYPTCPSNSNGGSIGQPDQGRGNCAKVCKNATITYSTPLNAGSTYVWTVTGASGFTGQGTNAVSVSWDTTGYGVLQVVETNVWGCVDTANICIEKIDIPIAGFTGSTNICLGSTAYFTNTSVGATSYYWQFGDGGNSTNVNPTHIYNSPGTYTITLIAENACHCRDTFTGVIVVDTAAGPDISCPATVCYDAIVTYRTSANCTGYLWTVTGGTIIGPNNLDSVVVNWNGSSLIGTLSLQVTGCSPALCPATTVIQIPILQPTAVITGDSVVCPNSTNTYSLPMMNGVHYTWSINGNAGGTIVAGQSCNSIDVFFPGPVFSPVRDTITCMYYDSFLNCGGVAKMVVRVRPKLAILGPNPACANDLSSYSTLPSIPVQWSVFPSGPIASPPVGNSTTINWNGVSGYYLIRAVAINPNSVCEDTTYLGVNVQPPPATPSITGDTIICPNTTVAYLASGVNINWAVTGGVLSAATGNSVNVTWGSIGPFILRAWSQDVNSPYCHSDTTVQNVTVLSPVPNPVILGSNLMCGNTTGNFSNSVIYPATAQYNWSINQSFLGSVTLGQGTTNITVQWGNVNVNTNVSVTLSVAVCNQTVTATKIITLQPAPKDTIKVLGNFCPGGSANLFLNNSYISYAWSGPGGFTSVVASPSITQQGNYSVTVTSANTCTATFNKIVNYLPAPTAFISSNDILTACAPQVPSGTLNALVGIGYTFAWSNGGNTPSITVNTPGAYNVTVTDGTTGCTAVSNTLVLSQNICPPDTAQPCIPNGVVSFNPVTPVCNPVSFTNTSVNASTFTWYFGDGYTSTATNPAHTYDTAGYYLVTLYGYVLNAAGTDSCLLQDTAKITVPLSSKFTQTYGCGGQVSFFNQCTNTPNTSITSYTWGFGDATFSNLPNPTHVYATGGPYNVTLTITDGTCTVSRVVTINVPNPPIASGAFASPECVNNNISFLDFSTGTGINYWEWSFGDLGTSLAQNSSHTYIAAGTYPITLIVKDARGCADTFSSSIVIVAPSVSGVITVAPSNQVCFGATVTLTAPLGTSYIWNNGATAQVISVNATGAYTVTVYDANNCGYVPPVANIIVNPLPNVYIQNSGDDTLCPYETITLSVQNNPGYNYLWVSNDANVNGSTQNSVSVFASSLTPGTYSYTLIAFDPSTGCSDTSNPYLVVVLPPLAPPVITLSANSGVCAGDSIVATAFQPNAISYLWSNGLPGSLIYVTTGGNYAVTVTDAYGCTVQEDTLININAMPKVDHFHEGCYEHCNPDTLCAPWGYASYQWLMNGVPMLGDTNQCVIITMNGAYSVILTTDSNCVDTTGVRNMTLYECDSACAVLIADTVYCDQNGDYIFNFYVYNNSGYTVNATNLLLTSNNPGVSYSPVTFNGVISNGGTSPQYSATITGAVPGDVLCFKTMIHAYDSLGNEVFCCSSDTVCYTMPDCDTVCCEFISVTDSFECVGYNSQNQPIYNFWFTFNGCGTLWLQPMTGIMNPNNPVILSGVTVVSGTYVHQSNSNQMAITFVLSDGNQNFCHDSTYLFDLPPCHIDCILTTPSQICVGQTAAISYGGNITNGSYQWQFTNGSPSTATGIGTHNVQYNTVGCHPIRLIITYNNLIDTCYDTICVLAAPVATAMEEGNGLLAGPPGNSYQWMNQNFVPINGATNQYFQPQVTGLYCVEVTSPQGCKDTTCIDFVSGLSDSGNGFSWTLYPNPNNGSFEVRLLGATEPMMLKIVNALGEVVMQTQLLNITAQMQVIPFNGALSSGVYVFVLQSEKLLKTERLVVK